MNTSNTFVKQVLSSEGEALPINEKSYSANEPSSEGWREPISQSFKARVLSPYRDHCRYLKEAVFSATSTKATEMLMEGEFAIADSCYIDDTGHFNAVEFNICFNQIAYTHLAYCIKHHLIEELNDYDISSFFQKQLSNFLIVNISSQYLSELNAKYFKGLFGIHSIRKRSQYTFMKTYCEFEDEHKGRAKGEVTLAIRSASIE
ncbi:FcoT family thioesterase [Marinibactrum halimedae]|uniref:(2E)-enoyl-[ACP] glycyltransferase n=1 Tax=Marinibactrum halimedae TaxID=1444977 RepID=A0AA37T1X4_9GAMM|nr:FcoT family thioesterase [Marinibactrum halimedae]MCD9458747.1 FcoT family thioesterase [Marinibactrum halimedae]GLS25304.1 hypothetical protein GCM10007877_10180 [Marinibactrum halimedae]